MAKRNSVKKKQRPWDGIMQEVAVLKNDLSWLKKAVIGIYAVLGATIIPQIVKAFAIGPLGK